MSKEAIVPMSLGATRQLSLLPYWRRVVERAMRQVTFISKQPVLAADYILLCAPSQRGSTDIRIL